MKRTFNNLIIALIIISFSSCSTGQSAFKKGNYYDATIKAVKNLRVKPESKSSLELIQKSYPMALEYGRQKVDELTVSNSTDKYLRIVETYTQLNTLADEISRCPAALEVLKPVVYFHKQLKQAELLAVKEQYNIAVDLLGTGDYQEARIALMRLQWVKEKQPDYSNIDQQLSVAKDLATLKIVVEYKPELHTNYDINSQLFYYRLYDFMVKQVGNEFTRFYKPETAEKLKIVPNEILTVQFLEFQIGILVEREKEKTFQSDSIVIGNYTDSDGNIHDVFGTVKAEVTTFERELMAKGLLEITVIDYQSGEIVNARKFPGDYLWANNWAIFNGDKRALPNQIQSLTKEKQKIPPSPQDLFLLLSDPLFFNATSHLRSYYRKK